MGYPFPWVRAGGINWPGSVRNSPPRQLAWRRGYPTAQHGSGWRRKSARILQTRSGNIPQDSPRKSRPFHGSLHEPSYSCIGDEYVQGSYTLHPSSSAKRQVQHEQDCHHRSTNITGDDDFDYSFPSFYNCLTSSCFWADVGNGLPSRSRHRPQGLEVEKHILGEREGHYNGLWIIQCIQTLQNQRVSTAVSFYVVRNVVFVFSHLQEKRRVEYSTWLVVLPGTGGDAVFEAEQRG